MKNKLLSVCLITYNHQDYIEQAIKSVFSQQVNFPVEFIICNDCSPDGTHEKIVETLKEAPQNFSVNYFCHDKNKGALQNFSFALSQCSGKYIAYFEGDDYWEHPHKLQKQVDFLEAHPDFTICCHNIVQLENKKFITDTYLDKASIKEVSTIEDLAQFNFIATLTAVFRNVEQKLPDWILSSPIGDLPLFMMVAKHGKIKFFNEKWAVYRSNIGEWSKMGNRRNLNMIKQYDLLSDEFKNLPEVKKNLKIARDKYIKEYLRKEKLGVGAFLQNQYFRELSLKDQCKALARTFIP